MQVRCFSDRLSLSRDKCLFHSVRTSHFLVSAWLSLAQLETSITTGAFFVLFQLGTSITTCAFFMHSYLRDPARDFNLHLFLVVNQHVILTCTFFVSFFWRSFILYLFLRLGQHVHAWTRFLCSWLYLVTSLVLAFVSAWMLKIHLFLTFDKRFVTMDSFSSFPHLKLFIWDCNFLNGIQHTHIIFTHKT